MKGESMLEEKYFYMKERQYSDLVYEKQAPTAYITLNRPDKLNALTTFEGGLCEQIHDACLEAEGDDEVKVIVIKAAGRAFSSGYDLSRSETQISAGEDPNLRILQRRMGGFRGNMSKYTATWLDAIWQNKKPVIAQVQGYCLAGGSDLACLCDLTIASEDAMFGYPPVRYSSAPVSSLWPYLIGMKHTKYLFLTGGMCTAQKAYEWGMINEVVPSDKLEDRVNTIAGAIALVPDGSVYAAKVMTNKYFEIMGLYTAMGCLSDYQYMVHESDPDHAGFFNAVREKGLKGALTERDAKFAFFDISPEMRARKLDDKK